MTIVNYDTPSLRINETITTINETAQMGKMH